VPSVSPVVLVSLSPAVQPALPECRRGPSRQAPVNTYMNIPSISALLIPLSASDRLSNFSKVVKIDLTIG